MRHTRLAPLALAAITLLAAACAPTATTGAGSASSPNVAVSRIPVVGYISFDDPTVGPLLAEAAEQAIERVVSALRAAF